MISEGTLLSIERREDEMKHSWPLVLSTLGACVIWTQIGCCAPMRFTEVTAEAGITHVFSHNAQETTAPELEMSGGAVAEDFNGDGSIDLYVHQGGEYANLLYINNGDGTFTDEAQARGVDLTIDGMGACAADYDNDGDVDIFVTTLNGPHYLLTNDGTGNFAIDSRAITGLRVNATSPSWGDIDNDGLLDLSIGLWQRGVWGNLFLFHNRGEDGFASYDFHETRHLDMYVFAARFADLNNDRLSDLPVTCDFGNSELYINLGNETLRRVTDIHGTSTEENGMGSAVGDYDNDGDLDWFVTSIWDETEDNKSGNYNWGFSGNRLYSNNGDGTFVDVTDRAGVRDGNWGWGASFGDLDNDGDLDLYHVNGWRVKIRFGAPLEDAYRFHQKPARLYENLGDGVFTDVAEASNADDRGQGRGSILFDYDNDGDLDIFNVNSFDVDPSGSDPEELTPGIPVLLRNDSTTSNHWLKVTLDGVPPFHRDGIGSRVYVTTGWKTQMRELNASSNYLAQGPGRIAHFGLGTYETANEVRAEWSNGDACILEDVRSDREIVLPSPIGQVTKRSLEVAEEVTATVGTSLPAGLHAEWVINGDLYTDPATVSFRRPGAKELRLNLYATDSGELHRSDLIRINVEGEASTVQEFSSHR